VLKSVECKKCTKTKPSEMFWYSKKQNRPTKWCKACLWADRWRKINGRSLFSKAAEDCLSEIYHFLGSEERIETFIHEIEHAARQKSAKNYNYVAIRLGRSIEFLTFVLCDFHGVKADEMAKNIINARKKIEEIESKYAALLDKKDKFETDDRTEVRNSFKNIINNLIEFEIEIAGGEISVQSGETWPSTRALLKRIGKKTGKKEQANSCVSEVTSFMNDYRNIAAHADCRGLGKQELRRSDMKNMIVQYELVLKTFAELVGRMQK
jgi:hypothetical protein